MNNGHGALVVETDAYIVLDSGYLMLHVPYSSFFYFACRNSYLHTTNRRF